MEGKDKDLRDERRKEITEISNFATTLQEEQKGFLEIFNTNGDKENAKKCKKLINDLEGAKNRMIKALEKLEQGESQAIYNLVKFVK